MKRFIIFVTRQQKFSIFFYFSQHSPPHNAYHPVFKYLVGFHFCMMYVLYVLYVLYVKFYFILICK